MAEKILIIDNGSYKCRVGFSDSTAPLFEFRNLIAKPRKDKKKDAPSAPENAFQIGDEIDVDAMRLLLKTQFERNVVTHPVYQEHIFDYILGRITPEGRDWTPQPILITEPLANPTYCRQTMNELFFECYDIPSICYGIDSALAWQHNRLSTEENSLIVNFGYHTTHVVPILNGQLQHDKIRRLNLGGYQMISYLYRLLQMKYPAHLNAISWTRMEDIFHNHSSVAVDYLAELRKWDNMDYYNANVKKIQLPYTAPAAPNPLAAEEKLRRRKEMAKRLIEANQKRLREKKGEELGSDAAVPVSTSSSTSSRNSKYQPPPNVPLEVWLEEIKKKHNDIVEKKSTRLKRRQEMVKRHTVASQERMRIISLLASHDKGSDEFGKDDKDWDVYKKISHENESDSDAENEKLMEYEGIMKYHQASMAKDTESIENTAEMYQLHVGVESLRAPELLFQPSMVGMYETGVAELLKFVFDNFAPEDQQKLADNVFITGGCSKLPGLKNRLVKELQEMRPFQSTFSVKESKNASLDAWLGGKDLANSAIWTSCLTTKADYMEKGTEYFKDYPTSNKYGFDRLVEDYIQEAMSRGDFNNLSCAGKPLTQAQTQNPYLDFTTHKLNKILIDNGFTPEWIMLQRDIREALDGMKDKIKKERIYYGEYPLNEMEENQWQEFLKNFAYDVKQINKNIDKYNLIVPIFDHQFFRVNLQRIGEAILKDPTVPCNQKRPQARPESASNSSNHGKSDFFSFIGSWF